MAQTSHLLYETAEDFRAHASTYRRFLLAVRYLVLVHLTAGAFYLLEVFTGVGWLGAALLAGVVFGVGFWANRRLDLGTVSPEAARLRRAPHAVPLPAAAEPIGEPEPFKALPEGNAGAERYYDPCGRWVLFAMWIVVVTGWGFISVPSVLGILGVIR